LVELAKLVEMIADAEIIQFTNWIKNAFSKQNRERDAG